MLVGVIFGNIQCWLPIRAEGHQNLIEYRMDLKMVSKQPQWILMNSHLVLLVHPNLRLNVYITTNLYIQHHPLS
jgi:hypothetical protein